MRALAIAALLMLAACGSEEKAEAPVAKPSPSGPRLGGVPLDKPLRATDNALTWSLEVAPGSITLTRFAGRGAEGSDVMPLDVAQCGVGAAGAPGAGDHVPQPDMRVA